MANEPFHQSQDYINKKLLDRKSTEISEFLEKEIMDHEYEEVDKLAFSQIYQSHEYAVMHDEIEKVDESPFDQIYKSLEDEVLETNKMHINAFIQSLEDEGMVDSQFRTVYLCKEDEAPSFFMDLIYIYFNDAHSFILNLTRAVESSAFVDFYLLNMHCLKLKGSSTCIGACTLKNGCSLLIEAVNKKSNNKFLQAVRNLAQVYNDLHTKMESFIEIEKEIVSAEERALGLM